MTASALTYIVAQEHINDLTRDAERSRRAAEANSPRRVRLPLPRVFKRSFPRTATA
jgi:hypothetical protein